MVVSITAGTFFVVEDENENLALRITERCSHANKITAAGKFSSRQFQISDLAAGACKISSTGMKIMTFFAELPA